MLALPELSEADARRLAASLEAAGAAVEASATRRVPTLTKRRALPPAVDVEVEAADACRRRTEAFVARVLVGLRQCPFTASPREAGVGLEEFDVHGAPILAPYFHMAIGWGITAARVLLGAGRPIAVGLVGPAIALVTWDLSLIHI